MAKFVYFKPEEKARAQNTDLVSLLRAQGERPIRSGREHRTPNDPSVTIRGNKWFDHSKREGGYAISFVQRYYRLPYPEAVLLLLGRKDGRTLEQAKPAATEPKPFALPEPYSNMRRVYAYLLHKRHIEREVVSHFTHEKLLYEDEHHNCVFVGMDGDIAKHAHLRSTNSKGKVFRINVEGSESAHSFHKDGTDKSLYVFEAPIDLLSHITLYPYGWQEHSYVACCGTSAQPVLERLRQNPRLDTVYLCLDNDDAGNDACERMTETLEEMNLEVQRLCSQRKDWNDDLCAKFEKKGESNMSHDTVSFVALCTGLLVFLLVVSVVSKNYSLNRIKSKTVGDGQHGTARWATLKEIGKTYAHIPFAVAHWRKGECLPQKQGVVVGSMGGGKKERRSLATLGRTAVRYVKRIWKKRKNGQYTDEPELIRALVDSDDIHCLMIGASGVGKTAYFLYPNLEYTCASGMSFLALDSKGDLARNYGAVASKYYGYQVSVVDLRNPTCSDGYNLLTLINRYMDLAVANPEDLKSRAKSEKYAKILSNTIINPSGDESIYGQNSYFYQAAEGVLTATILLLAEHLPPTKEQPEERRHIVSVFKLAQELLTPIGSGPKAKNGFQFLMAMMPEDHKARWFSGSALTTAEQSMNSVMSTVLSRLNAFLDSELEQVLCFDNVIDAERMAREKCAVFLILPEEDVTKHFMASLIVQALSQELFYVADKNGGKLPRRVIFFMDEFGTMPPFNVLPLFSAGRSRRLTLVPIIQSLAQLEKNYGKEGAAIIQDNCQTTIFGGFAPSSQTAEVLSKALGTRTVLSGSVSQGKESSQSLQMMERPLLSADELKSLPKGEFIVMKTGTHPMQTHLQLFLDWGIAFGEEYRVPEHGARKVAYANKEMLMKVIRRKYPPAAGKTPSSSEAEASGGKSAPAREEVQQEMIAAVEGAKRRAYNTPKAEDTT